MARISNFIYCLTATTSEKEANAIGVLSAINPDYVPGAFSFSILFTVLDLEEGPVSIRMRFKSPDDKELSSIDAILEYKKGNSNLPKEYMGMNIASSWQNVLFEKSGMYKTDVSINGNEYGSYEIFVKGRNEVD